MRHFSNQSTKLHMNRFTFSGNMGNSSSELPVASIPDAYVAVSICFYAKIRVMNATPEVKEMLVKLDQEITAKCGINRGALVDHYGTLKMKVGTRSTFFPSVGEANATLGTFFAIRLLEEMHDLGYGLITSTDLARECDNTTWYFAKSEISGKSRARARICCIGPGDGGRFSMRPMSNKLVLVRHDEHVKQAVMLALGDSWPSGVRSTKDLIACGERIHEIGLNGCWGWADEYGINTRKVFCNLVGRMGGLNWRLHAASNLTGTVDSYFFLHDPTYSAHSNEFCMLTLTNRDRLRLINCNELSQPLERAISSAGFPVQEKLDYHGCQEIKVHGNPWCTAADQESLAARRSISRVMEVFRQYGYTILSAIDISRRLYDKATILFRKNSNSTNCRFACLSLTRVDKIRFLDFPADVLTSMKDALYEFYPMGVRNEVPLPDSNLEINVNGFPWAARGRGMGTSTKGEPQYHMRAALGKMMAIAADYGWTVCISADVSSKMGGGRNAKHPYDVHSIYFGGHP